jgi:3-phosphoshikimate 1-carboxyvinyltransferase
MERPQDVYETLCKEQGFLFEKATDSIQVKGCLQAGNYVVSGSVSSQFITGLLYALPLTGKDSTITLTGKIESRSYINMTLQALKAFGIQANWQNQNTLLVQAGEYTPQNLTVEGDYSNAAFLDALTLMGGEVIVEGLEETSLQGDKVYREIFSALQTECATVSLADCPDLGPICMAVAAAFHGGVFTDTARLKIKESDRGVAMAQELEKMGIAVDVEENRILVHKGNLHAPETPLFGHNDHRIVMALATLCTLTGGVIQGAQAVTKSFPDYFEKIRSLGIVWKEGTQYGA